MKPIRKLLLSAAIIAITASAAHAYGPYRATGPCVNEDFIKEQKAAYEAQRNAQIQAIEAQQKAMAEQMKNIQQQQQAAMEAQRKAFEQAVPTADNSRLGEWMEAQAKAMQAQQQAITDHMQKMREQNEAIWQAQSKPFTADENFFKHPAPMLEGPYTYTPNYPLNDDLEAQRKAHLEAMNTHREEMQKRFQKMREQYEAARETHQKAFEEQRNLFNNRVALSEPQTTK